MIRRKGFIKKAAIFGMAGVAAGTMAFGPMKAKAQQQTNQAQIQMTTRTNQISQTPQRGTQNSTNNATNKNPNPKKPQAPKKLQIVRSD